ncbi:hypothetical protein WDU94_001093, partial [Cyamophila willieti]
FRRSSRPLQEDIVTPEKLSQETFRLLRTIQSLVNTREPDLAQRLTPSSSDLTLSEQRQAIDTNSVGSCSSLLHSSSYAGGSGSGSGTRKSLGESSSSCSTSTHCEELEVLASSSPRPTSNKPPAPASVEDESGFSSLSSFHESGLPEFKAYPELGLPLVESLDQRWNASPALSEQIRVLWV